MPMWQAQASTVCHFIGLMSCSAGDKSDCKINLLEAPCNKGLSCSFCTKDSSGPIGGSTDSRMQGSKFRGCGCGCSSCCVSRPDEYWGCELAGTIAVVKELSSMFTSSPSGIMFVPSTRAAWGVLEVSICIKAESAWSLSSDGESVPVIYVSSQNSGKKARNISLFTAKLIRLWCWGSFGQQYILWKNKYFWSEKKVSMSVIPHHF